jgi:SAM-dependent methyltransferase
VIRGELARLHLPRSASILDAGCGSGRMLDELADLGEVHGIDASRLAVEAARARGHERVELGAIERLPFRDASFDLVTCLDVLEHTPDELATLTELLRVTRPGGHLLVTVPAYQALWSAHDEVNDHYRRYTRRRLRAAALRAGWELERDSHFNSLLLAPAAVVRLTARRRRSRAAESELALTPSALDPLLELPLRAEAALMRRGLSLPAGLSIVATFARPLARVRPLRLVTERPPVANTA